MGFTSATNRDTETLLPTIFHEDWWLDLACEGQCNYVRVYEDKKLVCWMPYMKKSRYGMSLSRMPSLTHCLGPVFNTSDSPRNHAFRRRSSLTREMICKLPPFSDFVQVLHRDITDVIPFQANGFSASVQHTFLVESGTSEAAWKEMRPKTRNIIQTASKLYACGRDMSAADFLDFYQTNSCAAGRPSLKNEVVVRLLMTEAMSRGKGIIYYAVDISGKVIAAIFCLLDQKTCYYAMSTRQPIISGGAISMLIWQSIKDSIDSGRIFDFDGLAFEGSVAFYSGFTGSIGSRLIIRKTSRLFSAYHSGRLIFGMPVNHFTSNT